MGWFDSGTTMTRLGVQDGFTVHALGDRLYFLDPRGLTDRAIISAHGGHNLLSNSNTFVVPNGITLRFFSYHLMSVDDPGISGFYKTRPLPRETITGDGRIRSYDYILMKYQGTGTGETYESIAQIINEEAANRERHTRAYVFHAMTNNAQRANLSQRQARLHETPAIVTVRRRRFTAEMTLSLLLQVVMRAAPHIRVFDCLFCRAVPLGGSQPVVLLPRN